jgi:phosphate transport system substrate-binding protein
MGTQKRFVTENAACSGKQTARLHIRTLACALALLVTTAAIAMAADQITVAGSTTVKPIIDAAVQQYKKKNPNITFVVGAGGSSQGIQLVGNGAVNIGMASRPLEERETQQWSDLVMHKIGLDGVVLVANAGNAVTGLTREQVQNIYTGKITNWKELGGVNARIALYTLNRKHGTSDIFLNYFGLEATESGEGAAMTATHRKEGNPAYSEVAATVIEDHVGILAKVMTNPNALGYVSIGQALQVTSRGARIRLLALGGVAPTVANVRSGVYAFSRPLLVITRGEARGNVREFVEFLSGPEGQAIVNSLDYIPAEN